ncbi:hypothetical protein VM94_01320 [Janthinobacterium sp. KBS0711]|uniref:hypothetical protein n=1 Tax=Janthinobacterium sp. KBS0711 TaxID=1649647 RepID=UPI000627D731|nr:hypothetical protein [Janthinobacterium sp. KBS0711]KKO64616.1 hypothetical protein VM94_01320 [Janthinobacterium sp. KBS0711]TSD72325.1 hypothetical protein FFI39_015870 [Janthinobacterium sp. KBS0711]
MLKVVGPLILLACLALTAPAHAQDKRDAPKSNSEASLCAPVCASARQECRAQVQQATEDDTSPMLSMKPSSNPYAAASRETGAQSQQLQPTQAQAFRARRAERQQACDVQYRSCTRTCG